MTTSDEADDELALEVSVSHHLYVVLHQDKLLLHVLSVLHVLESVLVLLVVGLCSSIRISKNV